MLAFSFGAKDDLAALVATGLKRYAVKFGKPATVVLFRPGEAQGITLAGIELRLDSSVTDKHFFVTGE